MAGPEDTIVIAALMHLMSMKEQMLQTSRKAAPMVPWITELELYDNAIKQLSRGITTIVRAIDVPPNFLGQVCQRYEEEISGMDMPKAWVALGRIGKILTALRNLVRDTDQGLRSVSGYRALFGERAGRRLSGLERQVRENSITAMYDVEVTMDFTQETVLQILALGPREFVF